MWGCVVFELNIKKANLQNVLLYSLAHSMRFHFNMCARVGGCCDFFFYFAESAENETFAKKFLVQLDKLVLSGKLSMSCSDGRLVEKTC